MENHTELALEAAGALARGAMKKSIMLSPSLRRLCFTAPTAFGENNGYNKGVYHTLLLETDPLGDKKAVKEIKEGVALSVRAFGGGKKRRVLAVGLGNPAAVTDSLGAETVKRLSAGAKGKKYLATVIPSVFGLTGLETASVVKGIAAEYRPDLVVAVDTLSTKRSERLFRAVQITDGGLVPGGGVGNRRLPLCEEVLGVPVLALGVPLLAFADRCSSLPQGLVVTPKEIDLLVPLFASALAGGVEKGLFD